MALLPGSPAVNAGTPTGARSMDQRGKSRVGTTDIGAFESQGFTLTPVGGSTPQQAPAGSAFANPLAVTVTANNPVEPVAGGVVTFTVPSSGPSASLSAATATIAAGGTASVSATAGAITGTYDVTATAAGASSATFTLTDQVQPAFSALAAPTITYGTPTTTLSGTILAGTSAPPGSVTVTVDGVTQSAAIQSDGSFSTVLNTVGLGVAGSPYTITYAYAGSALFLAATDTSRVLTVFQDATTAALASSPNPTVYGQPVTFTATVTAAAPGGGTATGSVTFYDGATALGAAGLSGGIATFASSSLGAGSHSITAAYGGDANFTTSTSAAVSQTVTKDATTSTVTASANPSVFGQSVTFTATVAPAAPGGGTPTGTVTFNDGATTLGTAAASGGVATFVTSSLSIASHTITVAYGGDANFTSSTSAALTQTVTKDTTIATVIASANPSVFGQSVTFTATVSAAAPGSGTPTGTLTFKDGSTKLGSAALGGGTASFTTASLAVATHSITVSYGGDADFTSSASTTLSQVVNQAGTTTSITSGTNPSVFGQSVTFTATVSAAAPGSGTPTGSVTFYNGATTLGTASLKSGTVSFTAKALPTGSDAITAAYNGNGNFTPSTSAALSQNVNQDATTTSVTSSTNPSVFGQSVTFTATLTAAAPGSGTPTGTVTFLDGSITLSTATLSGGKATLKTTALAAGSHSITVSYGGDANFLTSTSAALSQNVNQASTSSTVTSSVNPSVFGQTVTFTATVKAVAPGSGTPTGTVTFTDGTTTLGTGALSGGTATFSISTLAVGSHSITVGYSGDTNFLTSTSPVRTQTVNQAATASSVLSSVNPSVSGQAVTFTATVTAVSPGSGTPTRTITFKDGSTVLGTASLNAGTASFTTSSLSVGNHSIKVVYGGDSNFKSKTSAVLTQVVNPSAAPSLAVTIAPGVVDLALGSLADETTSGVSLGELALDQVWVPRRRGRAASAAVRA